MATKNTKNKSAKSNAPQSLALIFDLESEQAALLAKLPWFNERFLLPGEQVEDYDKQLQLLIDSVEVKDALDLILVKDIHEELRDVQRMRTLRQAILLNGMKKKLTRLLDQPFGLSFDDDPRPAEAFTLWEQDPELGFEMIQLLLAEADITMEALKAAAFDIEAKNLQQIDHQLTRHEKNIRETIKMLEVRQNHKLMRKRLEFDLEQDRKKLLIEKSDGNG